MEAGEAPPDSQTRKSFLGVGGVPRSLLALALFVGLSQSTEHQREEEEGHRANGDMLHTELCTAAAQNTRFTAPQGWAGPASFLVWWPLQNLRAQICSWLLFPCQNKALIKHFYSPRLGGKKSPFILRGFL